MKFLKALSLLVCLFVASGAFAQATTTTFAANTYVANSITQMKSLLQKGGCKDALSDSQVLKLEKIYAAKEPRWNKIIASGLDKGDMAKEMAKLDAEYADQIEKVLSHEQKQAVRKLTASRIGQ
ncbi:MAG: hypothetical protein KBF57_12280 [Saprospiraceae bacterium]|jgi:hypothetical protein|nr:hypothetical protein [Saprospiraceae bacterium]MBP9195455.1 hypothetical protein [Saprospiraceae bacterium]